MSDERVLQIGYLLTLANFILGLDRADLIALGIDADAFAAIIGVSPSVLGNIALVFSGGGGSGSDPAPDPAQTQEATVANIGRAIGFAVSVMSPLGILGLAVTSLVNELCNGCVPTIHSVLGGDAPGGVSGPTGDPSSGGAPTSGPGVGSGLGGAPGAGDTPDTGLGSAQGPGTSGGDGSGSGSGGGSSGGGACFTANTPVLMADGSTKAIVDIKIDDMVMAFDGLGELTPQRVLKQYIHQKRMVVKLNGIESTPEHPFLTADGTYKTVSELEEGDILISEDGSLVADWSIEEVSGTYTVYNLSVDNMHTYVAGGLRVHNK